MACHALKTMAGRRATRRLPRQPSNSAASLGATVAGNHNISKWHCLRPSIYSEENVAQLYRHRNPEGTSHESQPNRKSPHWMLLVPAAPSLASPSAANIRNRLARRKSILFRPGSTSLQLLTTPGAKLPALKAHTDFDYFCPC